MFGLNKQLTHNPWAAQTGYVDVKKPLSSNEPHASTRHAEKGGYNPRVDGLIDLKPGAGEDEVSLPRYHPSLAPKAIISKPKSDWSDSLNFGDFRPAPFSVGGPAKAYVPLRAFAFTGTASIAPAIKEAMEDSLCDTVDRPPQSRNLKRKASEHDINPATSSTSSIHARKKAKPNYKLAAKPHLLANHDSNVNPEGRCPGSYLPGMSTARRSIRSVCSWGKSYFEAFQLIQRVASNELSFDNHVVKVPSPVSRNFVMGGA